MPSRCRELGVRQVFSRGHVLGNLYRAHGSGGNTSAGLHDEGPLLADSLISSSDL